MVEIRTWDENFDELTAFLRPVWKRFVSSDQLTPKWRSDELAWSLGWPDAHHGYLRLAAYQGTDLVGTLFALPVNFQTSNGADSRQIAGAVGSWLTLPPDPHLAITGVRLARELHRRQKELGLQLTLGIGVPSSAPDRKAGNLVRFWSAFARSFPALATVGRPLTFWVRVLDQAQVRAALSPWWIQAGAPLAALWPVRRGAGENGFEIAPYQPSDFAACQALFARDAERSQFAMVWDDAQLQHLLAGNDFPTTLLAKQDGQVTGLLSYHLVECEARTSLTIARIDHLILHDLSGRQRRRLIGHGLQQMRRDQAALAILLRSGGSPRTPLLNCGFFPESPGHRFVFVGKPPVEVMQAAHSRVLFR